jgi:hypothetical protein
MFNHNQITLNYLEDLCLSPFPVAKTKFWGIGNLERTKLTWLMIHRGWEV